MSIAALAALPAPQHIQYVHETQSITKIAEHTLWPGRGQVNCKTGSLVQTTDGTILSCWYGGHEFTDGNDESEPTSLWLSRYQARHWSEPVCIHKDTTQHIWNPVFLKFRSGKIALFFRSFTATVPEPRQRGQTNPPREFSYYVMHSDDQGKSWGEPKKLSSIGPTKCTPHVLDDGSLVIPTSKDEQIFVQRSFDEGTTWSTSLPILREDGKSEMTEPCFVPIQNGTFRFFARNRQADSHNRYIMTGNFNCIDSTFTSAVATAIPNPNSGIDACRLADGRIVLVANPTFTELHPLSVLLSVDDGHSFSKIMDLETGNGQFTQPAVMQAENGEIHIIYSAWGSKREDKNIKHVILRPKS